MNIRYSRLSTGDVVNFDLVKWAKSRLPVAFLRQQIFLVSIVVASFILFIFTAFLPSDIEYEPIIHDPLSYFNYGVIIDCGSSGSRAHIFRWSANNRIEHVRDGKTGKPKNKHIEPGLSSFKDNPERASDYMEPLMKFISESIPKERHKDTPIHFMATAGLRLLDDSTQKKILDDINQDIGAKFDFPIKSQVISGSFEGVYSWLSLNTNRKFSNNSTRSYGMVELGGASAQVTYELSPEVESAVLKDLDSAEAIEAFKNEQVTLRMGSSRLIRLFATTFLGIGVNSARQAAIDLLVKDYLNLSGITNDHKITDLRLKDPCLTESSSEIVLRPTSLLQNTQQTIGFIIKPQEDTLKVRLEGTGNFMNCMNLLDRTLQLVKKEQLNCIPSKPCSMALLGTKFIPYQLYQFIGLSEFFFTTNEMMNSAGLFNRQKVLHETKRICQTDYNRLLESYSNNGVSHEDRILYECFKASWLLTLIHSSGFKMPEDYEHFKTVEQLDGNSIDWTMGAMITEIGSFPIRAGSTNQQQVSTT